MARILLKENDSAILYGNVKDITPMGVECDVELEDMDCLRNDAGKYKSLELEINVSTHRGQSSISGSGCVYSVRRISQKRCMVNIRFTGLEQNGYRMISEHMSPTPVVSITEAREARTA